LQACVEDGAQNNKKNGNGETEEEPMFNPRALLVAGLIALAGTGTSFAQAELKVGYVPTTDMVLAAIAKDKGFFDKRGLNVTLTRIALISNIPAAIISNSIQVGMTTAPGFLQATEAGLDLVAVAGLTKYNRGRAVVSLVAGKESGISKVADLKGKKLGVPGIGSMFDVTFRKYLTQQNVRPADVTVIEASFPTMADLVRGKQLDAVLVIEPFRSRIVDAGIGVRVVDFLDDVLTNQTMAFWIGSRQWSGQNARTLASFREGVAEGLQFLQSNEPQAREIEKKYLGVNAKVLPAFELNLPVADLKFFQDLGKEVGLLKGTGNPATLILQ
jgi:NitT/TauT family transport system substrate-binding protein